ncbi:unnamed protein product [Rotaria sordida]|uniref:ADP ribosyltransferase domain-containing protein n=1 Tax=Rotaria sordida TaxID=392033 RepID=A0A819GKL8_9BILA|nr:unnamed protein product [Rotaria sordida]CAF1471871.1 unnamed protein product [Rotaria sordida]CAF3848790.1 unnamed protein product [Rotaria sordida]CAF3883265.1 unnamed protein product [Rotaria sordida]
MTTQIIRKRNRRPSEIEENLEDVTLIWLDSNIDDSSDSLHTQSLLDELSNCVLLYTDFELCINYIRRVIQERVFVIVSGTLSHSVLPSIHSLKVVTAIFIFCNDHKGHIPVLDTYSKVMGIFTDQQALLQSIQKTKYYALKQTVSFSVFDHQKQKSTRDVSKDLGSFTWFQLLVDILRKIPQTDRAKQDMLDKCREYYALNKTEMKKIEQFELTYTEDKAIEWYTRDAFVYRLVNKALRTEDVELLYLFRLYITDLCSQLEHEWKRMYNEKTEILTLYRGQTMSIEELDKLNNSIGILISTNGFFSTTRDIQIALEFLAPHSDDQTTVLFEIKADCRLQTVVFADIDNFSQMEGEQEVLFGLRSVFKINNIRFDPKLCCWKIQMTATDEGSVHIQGYLDAKRKQIDDLNSAIVLFGRLLFLELGQMDKAEKYFRMLLKTLPPEHEDFASACNNLGNVLYGKNQLNLAFDYFARAYILRRQRLRPQHPQIAGSLINIGFVLHLKGHHQNALYCLEKAVHILDSNYDDHYIKAIAINGIGLLYRDKKEYKTALEYFNRALNMHKRLLPQQHPDIASCLSNIGLVYEDLLDYDQALVYYRHAFEMDEKILPCSHPNLIDDFNRIIDIYEKKGEDDNALEFCQKTLIEQQNNGQQSNLLIAHIVKNMGDIAQNVIESINYCRKALVIFEQLLNPTDLVIIYCLIDISRLYWKCDIFDDALTLSVPPY